MSKVKIFLILFVIIFVFSCKEIIKQDNESISNVEKLLVESLINGFFTKINESIYISIYEDNVFCFKVEEGSFKKGFFLQLTNKNGDIDNFDFSREDYILQDSLTNVFSKFNIVHRNIKLESYMSLIIGQFKNKEGNGYLWKKDLSIADISKKRNRYFNELKKGAKFNVLNEKFNESLLKGRFFRNSHGFYVLLTGEELFLISNENAFINKNYFVHLIRQDNTFKNISFPYNFYDYQMNLNKPYRNYKVVRVNISSNNETFSQIRIGQYDVSGNMWVQQFDIDEVKKNELLKYKGELGL